jgi:hypothetical protein
MSSAAGGETRMGQSFECGLCGSRRAFEYTIRVYDTPEQVSVIDWPCWCWACDAVSLAEYIPDPAEVIEEAKAWRRRDRDREYRITCGPLSSGDDDYEPKVLSYYDAVLTWRRRRQSPSRCLFCESVKVSLAATRYGKFEHPSCGGMFECLFSIFGGIRRMTKEVFSSEGTKLSEEQVIA